MSRNIEWKIEMDKLTCTWNGAIAVEEKPLVFQVADLPGTGATKIKEQLMLHGLKQKLSDSISGLAKRGDSILEQQGIMKAVWETLVSGSWTIRKPGEKKVSRKEIQEKAANAGLSEKELEVLKKLNLI